MSLYPEEPIDPFLREARDAFGSIEKGIGMSVGFGIFTPDGRQVAVTIEELPDYQITLTDAGETWSDLMMDGFFDCLSPKNLARFNAHASALCTDYKVVWTGKGITWTGPRSDWVAAAKRICAVSLAIDSWRHWLTEGT